MDCIKKEFVRTDADGHKWWRVILTATETPESLDNLTGADVDGMDDNIRFAAGSVLLTPDGNSVLYADGWSEGGGDLVSIALSIDLGGGITVPLECTPALPSSVQWAKLSDSEKENGIMYAGETPEGLMEGQEVNVTVTPSTEWYAYNNNDEAWGEQGEPVKFIAVVEEETILSCNVIVAKTPDFEDPDNEIISVYIDIEAGGK